MCNKGISGKQRNLWLLSAVSAPLAQVASGCSWLVVLITGAICAAACWILHRIGEGQMPDWKWFHGLHLIWVAVVLSQLCRYPLYVWPKNESQIAVPVALLALAAWSADRGQERASRAGNAVFWFLLVLYGAVMASAIGEVKVENLTGQTPVFDPMLVVIFLIPVIIRGREKGYGWGLLGSIGLGTVLSVLTIGTLGQRVVAQTESPFYELSRSLSFLGIAERFESLIASAMTLGYFVVFSLLLSSVEKGKLWVWLCAILGGIGFAAGIKINGWYLAIGSIIIWYLIPFGGEIIRRIKSEKSA